MIEASWCEACGRVAVPGEEGCLECRDTTGTIQLAPSGRILARTRLRGSETWIVLVMLGEGARVLATVDEKPRVGSPCEVHMDGEEVTLTNVGEPSTGPNDR